ncbi:unnamed protein product [Cuscuta epithymum]|uniref:Cystatin domain-containing protein n=1 Tax=Cuscuta epithymum TaxID=186058 RepID=A0AAV0EH05_9ASTE|nr:unnamed protein product [Cuscuta epithymum]
MEGKKLRLIKLPLLLSLFLLLILAPPSSAAAAAAAGRKVGGRKEVKDVKSNQEIQELGKYCVLEYNKKNLHGKAELLSFSEVVEAETQVVSGIKYYLKISAATAANGVRGYYDAVVWVKPWAAKPKKVLKFAPSSPQGVSGLAHKSNPSIINIDMLV